VSSVKKVFCLVIAILWSAASVAGPSLSVLPAERHLLDDVSITLSGALPNGQVVIDATLQDASGRAWSSRGEFFANSDGTLDLSRDSSLAGTYTGADLNGLFWSMLPVELEYLAEKLDADPAAEKWPIWPMFAPTDSIVVTITARMEVDHMAFNAGRFETVTVQHTVHQVRGAVEREVIDEAGIHGVLYQPSESSHGRPIMIITGSGGGVSEGAAARLAGEGYTALALAHFAWPGRPDQLSMIPLEYFSKAMTWLGEKTGTDQVAIMGASRGGEGVLLIASAFPDQVSAVISGVPSNVVFGGCCTPEESGKSAWTLDGEEVVPAFVDPMKGSDGKFDWATAGPEASSRMMRAAMMVDEDNPGVIKVENIQSPVLLVSGGDDGIWPGRLAGDRVVARLKAHGFQYPYEHLAFSGAGHLASRASLVTSMLGVEMRHPRNTDLVFSMGGVPADNYYAGITAERRILEFLGKQMVAEESVRAGTLLEGLQKFSLQSSATGQEYMVLVSLPFSYGMGDKDYPLLLTLDSNYLFGTMSEMATMQALRQEAQELIVVSVGTNAGPGVHGTQRLRDYMTPDFGAFWENPKIADSATLQGLVAALKAAGRSPEDGFGGAKLFQQFLLDELLPQLQDRYRIDISQSGLAGHSGGGAFAAFAMLDGKLPFSRFIIGSPAVFYDKQGLSEALDNFKASLDSRVVKAYAAYGGAELTDPVIGTEMSFARDNMKKLNRVRHKNFDMTLTTFDEEWHASVFAHLFSTGLHTLWPGAAASAD